MIVVTGTEGTREREEANAIAAALTRLWPGLDTSPASDELVHVAAGVKLSGYRVNDIDVLVAGRLRAGRAFVPKQPLRGDDGSRVVAGVQVESFAAAIEVKDHDPGNTRITGDIVEVHYATDRNEWRNATEQNVLQVHSVKPYFEQQGAHLFIHRALILSGFDRRPCAGALPKDFDGAAFMTALCELTPVFRAGRFHRMRAGTIDAVNRALASPAFRTLRPSSLDRRRMDRIITKSPLISEHSGTAGQQMLRLRGHGGAGKTLMLLQLAWRAFDERAARSIVLTYNHALAGDICRLMALLSVPSDAEGGGVYVRTVMGFISAWLAALGIAESEEDWSAEIYERRCSDALQLFKAGALTAHDIEDRKSAQGELFSFDLIVADEAQDWPQAELELLKILYPPNHFCLADGIDQLVRGRAANWDGDVAQTERVIVPLRACLRMKANLARFVNAAADLAGLNWSVEPNPSAGGGRVILLRGGLSNHTSLVQQLLAAAKAQGNDAIDNLFCVPPSGMTTSADERHSMLADALSVSGLSVWDGTRADTRRDFPRDNDALRIVQYASCRGLEGWTVFLDAFDTDWPTAMRSENTGSASWVARLVPLTRAIDTLVISLDQASNEVSQVLLSAGKSLPDFVDIL